MDNLKEDPEMWYLPYFPVIRKGKATANVQLGFDAAAKTNRICLNDTVH